VNDTELIQRGDRNRRVLRSVNGSSCSADLGASPHDSTLGCLLI